MSLCQAVSSQSTIIMRTLPALFTALTVATASAAERPNILFIFSDDHALQAITAYGNSRYAKHFQTPNIDRLAKEGGLFVNSFCANSICGPSRACILTGKHSVKNGYVDNNTSRFDGSQPTFPKYLGAAGYETAVIGKWHLVSNPTGFDHWEVLPGQGSYWNPDFIQMDGSKKRVEGYVTDIITDKTIDWLENRKDKTKPFVLMSQHKAPHRNWMPAERHMMMFDGIDLPEPESLFDDYSGRSEALKTQEMSIEKDFFWGWDMFFHEAPPKAAKLMDGLDNGEYKRMTDLQKRSFDLIYGPRNQQFLDDLKAGKLTDKEITRWKYQRYIKNYLATIRALDENIGRLLAYLDDNGLAENTIVIYSSDQSFFLGEKGWYDKRWMFEESLTMPFLIRWPGVVKPGIRPEALIQNIDYAPTFLEVAGVDVPPDMQGRSILPILKNDGKTPDGWRDAIYYFYTGEATHQVPAHDGIRSDRHKIFYLPRTNEWQLFDLIKDPQEMRSIHDDPAYAEIFTNMKARYQEMRTKYEIPKGQPQ
jgi:arylsulfatase A-like enzyme